MKYSNLFQCLFLMLVGSAKGKMLPDELLKIAGNIELGYASHQEDEFSEGRYFTMFYMSDGKWNFMVCIKSDDEEFWRVQMLSLAKKDMSSIDMQEFPKLSRGKKHREISGISRYYFWRDQEWVLVINAPPISSDAPEAGKLSIRGFMARMTDEVRDGWRNP